MALSQRITTLLKAFAYLKPNEIRQEREGEGKESGAGVIEPLGTTPP
jgi:hypothetical protein